MSKGVLLFAGNNDKIDYVKQAYFLAKRISKYLGLPTTIATDSVNYLYTNFSDADEVFDNVIDLDYSVNSTQKRYYDGALSHKLLVFKNGYRNKAFELSPYDETILLDTDFIISDDTFLHCFNQSKDFLIYKEAYDLAGFRDYSEFKYVSDTSIEFYWATCVFFRKTQDNEIFFNLLQHICEDWQYYTYLYKIKSKVFRNDHAFSIAIHIMNGWQQGPFAGEMPGKMFYTIDRDILHKLDNDKFYFLVEKQSYVGEYTPIVFSGKSVHVMNKFSLNRCINEQ